MFLAFRNIRLMILMCLLPLAFLAGCDGTPESSAPAKQSDAKPQEEAATNPQEASAPVPIITGNEALPPNHPPLPGAGLEQVPPSGALDPAQMPAGHPALPDMSDMGGSDDAAAHPVPLNKDLAINMSEEIRSKWSAVVLGVAMAGGDPVEFEVPIGGQADLAEGALNLKVEVFVPSYKSDFNTITSASDSLDNPAVKVVLVENNQVLTKGWVFQNLPEFNSFKSDKLDVRLISAKAAVLANKDG